VPRKPLFDQLLKIRYLAVVIVILAACHAIAFLALGTKIALHAYMMILGQGETTAAARPGLELLHSLDFLFVSLVLMILSLGVAKLFLLDPTKQTVPLPPWIQIDNVTELKVLLWETILTTLLIVAMSDLVTNLGQTLAWTVLIVPIAILILALGLYFMKRH
jgi:uncharacterized membrane protein YqhA